MLHAPYTPHQSLSPRQHRGRFGATVVVTGAGGGATVTGAGGGDVTGAGGGGVGADGGRV